MIEMLILNAGQAAAVAGPTSPGHRLEPVELVSGEFVLPSCVIEDEAHAGVADQLVVLPARDVALEEFPAAADE